MQRRPTFAAAAVRGAAAGIAGSVAMTAFQKLVEMPLTGRPASYAPARFAEKVLPISPAAGTGRTVLNYAAHVTIGAAWGVGHALVARSGLRGQRAVGAAFCALYVGDVLVNMALGLYKPWRWSAADWTIDVGEKLLLAEGTGYVYEQIAARP